MKLSKSTFEVLSQASRLNDQIAIYPGNVVLSCKDTRTTIMEAVVQEPFSDEMAFYSLRKFLSTFKVIEGGNINGDLSASTLTVNADNLQIKNGNKRVNYALSDANNLTVQDPNKNIDYYISGHDVSAKFTVCAKDMSSILSMSKLLSAEYLSVNVANGSVTLVVMPKSALDNRNSDDYKLKIESDAIELAEGVHTSYYHIDSISELFTSDYTIEIYSEVCMVLRTKDNTLDISYMIAPQDA